MRLPVKPISNWKAMLRLAWSVRLYALSFVLQLLASAPDLLFGLVSDRAYRFLSLAALVAGFAAQFTHQKEFPDADQ